MKRRLKNKLKKEDISVKNFALEYKQLNRIKEQNQSLIEVNNKLNCHICEITPKEVIISKSMYFGLIGYLPKDLKLFISNYKEMTCLLNREKFPIKIGTVQIGLVNIGIFEKRNTLLEEIYIEEINEEKGYVIFLFKGFQIRIKVPIKMQFIKTKLNGVNVETTCWNWDFVHAGIRVISDNDFSSLIESYKSAIEFGYLVWGKE